MEDKDETWPPAPIGLTAPTKTVSAFCLWRSVALNLIGGILAGVISIPVLFLAFLWVLWRHTKYLDAQGFSAIAIAFLIDLTVGVLLFKRMRVLSVSFLITAMVTALLLSFVASMPGPPD